jgi:hypothetical protein
MAARIASIVFIAFSLCPALVTQAAADGHLADPSIDLDGHGGAVDSTASNNMNKCATVSINKK